MHMKGVLIFILTLVALVFFIAVVGSIALEQFPTLVPLWEELKMQVSTLYNIALVKYGAVATIMLIFAIFILVGSSKG